MLRQALPIYEVTPAPATPTSLATSALIYLLPHPFIFSLNGDAQLGHQINDVALWSLDTARERLIRGHRFQQPRIPKDNHVAHLIGEREVRKISGPISSEADQGNAPVRAQPMLRLGNRP